MMRQMLRRHCSAAGYVTRAALRLQRCFMLRRAAVMLGCRRRMLFIDAAHYTMRRVDMSATPSDVTPWHIYDADTLDDALYAFYEAASCACATRLLPPPQLRLRRYAYFTCLS